MSRLGELAVAAGLITPDQLAEALRAQVMWGGRLGTNLIELGHISLDDLSTTLGRQHGMPAALGKHFDRGDRELQRELSPDVAERVVAMPLVRAGKRVVIVVDQPLAPKQLAVVADELGLDVERIVLSVAAELRLRYQLERVYGIRREQRFLRVKGHLDVPENDDIDLAFSGLTVAEAEPEPPPEPEVEAAPVELPIPQELDVPEISVEIETQRSERRSYLQTLGDLLGDHPDKESVVANLDRLARRSARPTDNPIRQARTFDQAVKAIFTAPDRDQVALRTVATCAEYLHNAYATLLLVIRGEAAVSWLGFCRDGTELPPIAVPLDKPGLVPAVIRRRQSTRGASGDLNTIDYLLLVSLGLRHGDLFVSPISVGASVVGLMVTATTRDQQVDGHEEIATIAGAAFGKLMRAASRR